MRDRKPPGRQRLDPCCLHPAVAVPAPKYIDRAVHLDSPSIGWAVDDDDVELPADLRATEGLIQVRNLDRAVTEPMPYLNYRYATSQRDTDLQLDSR